MNLAEGIPCQQRSGLGLPPFTSGSASWWTSMSSKPKQKGTRRTGPRGLHAFSFLSQLQCDIHKGKLKEHKTVEQTGLQPSSSSLCLLWPADLGTCYCSIGFLCSKLNCSFLHHDVRKAKDRRKPYSPVYSAQRVSECTPYCPLGEAPQGLQSHC